MTGIPRIVCLTCCLCCVAWPLSHAEDTPQNAGNKPNIVFFLVDDLGVMDIGAYNPDTFYETPNVDCLAKSGVQFRQGYAACCVCSPTRFSIMTGKYPVRNGCTNYFGGLRSERFHPAPLHEQLDLDETTLAEAFQEAGYKTAFLGKWHLGPTAEFWPENQGFDVNIGGCNAGAPSSYFAPYRNPRLPDGPDGEFLTERLANEAVAQIKAMKDSPFFLYFSFYQVHVPLMAPEPLIKKYREKAKRLGLPTSQAELFTPEEQTWPTDDPRLVRERQTHAVYAAMVESMDSAVGRVVEALREEGVLDNTILCFVADNGGLSTAEGSPTSNWPLRGGKGWLYEGGHRVAFIIRTPDGKPTDSDVPVITNDFYPTLLDLAGLPLKPEQHRDGVSLKPIIDGTQTTLDREALFWHYPHYANQGGFPGGVIRKGDWKLIRRYEDGRTHLYHLNADPSEQHDLSAAEPERTRALAAELDQWLQSTGARFLREKDGLKPWQPD